ncbi:MAG: alpha-amylase family glycosyl hydrolase [Eubacteriales bacterium]|nr:alpha-amylase family glycosyl hydrolase [Eubacteriales bacterium]
MKYTKNITRITALLLLAAIFVACRTEIPSDNHNENPSGAAGYSVMRGDTASPVTTQAAVKLRRAIAEATGEEIGIATDYIKDPSEIPGDAREILVGETNRAESADAVGQLGEYDYIIKRKGERIIIAGGSDMATAAAVDRFIADYIDRDAKRLNITEDLNYMHRFEKTDNSSLIPPYVPDTEVTLVPAEPGGKPMTPDWVKTLIMTEVHIETATPGGTFEAALPVLDHLAETGVNGIWVTPIYEKGPGGNGYGNIGPHTVEPALTGTTDPEKSWESVKNFVDEAHKRNIRVILDIITWGTVTAAPLFTEHPDWYSGTAWGNQAFDWTNEQFREWFISVAVENIIKTGADGYRCDCEPNYTGYSVFEEVRRRCAEAGRKILIIAEDGCRRKDTYDFEQDGVLNYTGWSRGEQYQTPKKFYIDQFNIVDSVKNGIAIGENSLQQRGRGGQYRFYTYCVSNHDFQYSIVNGNRLVLGYQAILAPFIPLWYYGEEFNLQAEKQVFYFVPVDRSLLDDYDNRMFFEDIKKYIGIRRSYPEIFEYYPEDHRDSNICAVDTEGTNLTAYARYAGDRGVIVVPNNNNEGKEISALVHVPFDDMFPGPADRYTVTDLMTGRIVAEGTRSETSSFDAVIKNEHMGVYLIEKR